MSNAFQLLSLPCSLLLSQEEIDSAWRELSQVHHPDLSDQADGDMSSAINAARATLQKSSGRLTEWLKGNDQQVATKNTAISSGLMDIFSTVNGVLNEADEVLASLKKAQTALAKSLLAPKAIQVQMKIQSTMGDIMSHIAAISAQFPDFEKDKDFTTAKDVLGELKFLEKWERECQARLLALIAID